MNRLLLLASVLACCLLASPVVTASNGRIEMRHHDEAENDQARKVPAIDDVNAVIESLHPIMEFHTKDRELQGGAGQLLQLIQSGCSLVGQLMLIDSFAICDCTFGFSLEFTCILQVPICAPGDRYCATPNITGSFDFLQTQVTFGYCSNEGTFDGAPIPNFCVSTSGFLLAPSSSISSSKNSSTSTQTEGNGLLSRLFPAKRQFLNSIDMTVGGKSCRAVSLCNNGQGYQFDCTNINVHLKQSACTPLQTLMNLKQAPGSVKYLPSLDDPVPVPTPVSMPSPVKRISPPTPGSTIRAPTKAMMKRLA